MQSDRLYQLKDLIQAHPGISLQSLTQRLERSPATVKRQISALRDRFDMPIVFDREIRGYRVEAKPAPTGGLPVKLAELPGLWFTPDEALALLTAQHLLASIEPGLLDAKLNPLRTKLKHLLEAGGSPAQAVHQRVKVLQAGKRRMDLGAFQQVARATLDRKRLRITHLNRERGEQIAREVSPQQMVHYRDNWYLDAWCHLRNGLRSFAVDGIQTCTVLETPAQEVPAHDIAQALGGGYGIFGGQPKAVARLKFTPEKARWVSLEQWHPEQKSWYEQDGSFVLELPYSDERELLGDVLRYGDGVVVESPPALRASIQRSLLAGAMRYASSN